jgi:hypothetical protein
MRSIDKARLEDGLEPYMGEAGMALRRVREADAALQAKQAAPGSSSRRSASGSAGAGGSGAKPAKPTKAAGGTYNRFGEPSASASASAASGARRSMDVEGETTDEDEDEASDEGGAAAAPAAAAKGGKTKARGKGRAASGAVTGHSTVLLTYQLSKASEPDAPTVAGGATAATLAADFIRYGALRGVVGGECVSESPFAGLFVCILFVRLLCASQHNLWLYVCILLRRFGVLYAAPPMLHAPNGAACHAQQWTGCTRRCTRTKRRRATAL